MEMAVARLEVNLPGPEVVRAGQEVARAMIKYNSNLFWAMGRDWKSEIWHGGVVGHGNGSGQVGGEPPRAGGGQGRPGGGTRLVIQVHLVAHPLDDVLEELPLRLGRLNSICVGVDVE